MPKFSKTSLDKLESCDPRIQVVLKEAIKHYDFSVLCGYRGEVEQTKAYVSGNSNAKFGQSKHNGMPSEAVYRAPYPIDWDDKEEFAYLAGLIMGIAASKEIRLRWGGRFKKLKDMPHFELMEIIPKYCLCSFLYNVYYPRPHDHV